MLIRPSDMIRNTLEQDIHAIIEIEKLCFTSQWTYEMFLYELHENEFGHFYVLSEGSCVLGFIDFWITFEVCQLANIAIHPAYQGRGYSKKLMDFMIDVATAQQCETIMLEVRVSNDIAKKLYNTYEFIEMNIRKGYYSDNGEDAIVMCKALGGD